MRRVVANRAGSFSSAALAGCAILLACVAIGPLALAQDPAGSAALPPGHPPVANTENSLPDGHPPVPATDGALPAGHPSVGAASGMEQLPGFRQMPLPETIATEAADLPAGVVLVRVVDARGAAVDGVTVRLGSLREGERSASIERTTRADGVAQFEALATGSTVAWRASTEHDGARFLAPPFQLPTNVGYRVQLVRFDTAPESRAVLISEARIEIAFQEDRLVVVERASIVNFSNMSLNGGVPRPVAYVPHDGLHFHLPAGYTVFRSDEQSMGDQHVVEEHGDAVVHGSIPPTGAQDSINIVFQYRVKIDGTDAALDLSLPLPVLRATVVSQAPMGMHLEVAGMPEAEERSLSGQRILITGRERASHDDAPLDRIRIRLTGIPAAAGPERTVAAVVALAIALAALLAALRNRQRSGRRGGAQMRAALDAEKARLLDLARDLAREHAAGDIGPETLRRRRRELSVALAEVLKEIASMGTGSKKRERAA